MSRDMNEGDGTDLDALFAAEAARRPGPPVLDARVLAAVRAETHPVARRRPAPRWLAAAAVLVMAAVLVPLVRQAPEPLEPPEPPEPSGTPVAPAPAEALSRDEVALDAGIGGESAPVAEPEAAPPARESAPPARTSATLRAPAQREESIPSSKATGARQRTDAVTMDGEASPERWMARLRERLRHEGATEALREDYRRFRARYPEVEPDADLERALGERETGTGDESGR